MPSSAVEQRAGLAPVGVLDRHRHDLASKLPASVVAAARRCDSSGERVHLLAADAPLVGQDLRHLELRLELPVARRQEVAARTARRRRDAFDAIGARVIDSTPQAMAMS